MWTMVRIQSTRWKKKKVGGPKAFLTANMTSPGWGVIFPRRMYPRTTSRAGSAAQAHLRLFGIVYCAQLARLLAAGYTSPALV